MDKIYLKDNYIVTELGGVIAVFPKNYSSYSESSTGFYINSTFPVNNQRTVFVDFTRVTSVYNEAGTVAYSIATLRAFLLLNTGFKSPSGGSGGSSITVGTTPVTGGTDGRVFFQAGGVVQQDSSFFWDNTNKRLGIGTSIPNSVIQGVSGNCDFRFSRGLSGLTPTISAINTDSTGKAAALLAGTSGSAFAFDQSGFFAITTETKTAFTGNTVGGGTARFVILGSNGNIGIGTGTTAGARLDVRAQGALSTDIAFRVRNSADTRNFLVVNGAGDVYNNGAGGVTSNTFYGENVGRSATGDLNTFFGNQAGRDNTTASTNTFIGASAGRATTTGGSNTFVGRVAGLSNISGASNVYIGSSAGQNATGTGNAYIGANSALNITTGNSNIFIGNGVGQLISSGSNLTLANESIFIGQGVRANANSETNQIVIGHSAIGTGSNSVTLGNTSITRTNLRGQVVISGFASAPTGVEGAIYYDSTTKKHYGFDGTNWNALY